ncbi:HAD domain-containing protein [Dactylosporangium sp. NPDC051485]|uniref:HAD domain-containing protein n=1 Tax=Dactylosporangium sp. NPDC051485 TaxID=3154846 RepID=UPI00341FABF2
MTAGAAAPTRATGRPVVAVDVDGVLNPDDPAAAEQLGYRPRHYAGPDPTGNPITGTVWLHPKHGTWLAEIAGAGAELVWCTSWGPLAATFIASRLGLPTDLTVIDVTTAGVRWGHQLKLFDLYQHTGTRPVAVLDDQFGGKDPDNARSRTRSGVPTLLVPVDPHTGLRRDHVDTVLTWLDDITGHHDRSPVT